MLMPDQVVPFLLHDDPIVHNRARTYFFETYVFGPLTVDHLLDSIDRVKDIYEVVSTARLMKTVPQTDSSIRRLLEKLPQTKSQRTVFQYQDAIRNIDLQVLVRNRELLMQNNDITPEVRQHFQRRLDLLDQAPMAQWERLMAHDREFGDNKISVADKSEIKAMIEAAARGGDDVLQAAIQTLNDPEAQQDWREMHAVQVLGLARYEPAIDGLLAKSASDTDFVVEAAVRSLSRIGTPRVIERINELYAGKPWNVRLFMHGILKNIKQPASVDALLKCLETEREIERNPGPDEGEPLAVQVLQDLNALCSLAGLDEARKESEEYPNHPETIDMLKGVLATSIMTGTEIPEYKKWRSKVDAIERQFAAQLNAMERRPMQPDNHSVNKKWITALREIANADDEVAADVPAPTLEKVMPIRNTAPKVGRNDPCPCGSGKKFKKCCGKP